MNIAIPDEIPLRALAGALATLGLVLDGSAWSDGIHRARWASECLGTRCNEPGCVMPASISLGNRRYCASHAGYHMTAADLRLMSSEDIAAWRREDARRLDADDRAIEAATKRWLDGGQ